MNFALVLASLLALATLASAGAFPTVNTTFVFGIGASEFFLPEELAASNYKLGRIRMNADPVYDNSNANRQQIGYTNGICRQIYMDANDAEYGSVIGLANYEHDHQRHFVNGDSALVGKGLYYCKITVQLPNGRVSLQGHWEGKWARNSQLVVTGGTGQYQNVRGVAHLDTVNVGSCNNNAFQIGATPASCFVEVTLQLAYPTGIPAANAATAATRTKVFYEYFGAVDSLIESDDVAASNYKIGNSVAFGNPVLDVHNADNPSVSTSYTSGACYETYLSSNNPSYQTVQTTVGSGGFHPRPGALAGKSALECYYTIVFPNGQIVLQGIVENNFSAVSTLAIAGGTGSYVHAKGTADRSYVNPNSCKNDAFKKRSLTSDCIVRTQLNIIQSANFPVASYTPKNFWWIECGGANVGTEEDEIALPNVFWKLGNYMPFGAPLYNSTLSSEGEIPTTPTGGRIGHDGGDCNKVYLDRTYDQADFARSRRLPGFHTQPQPFKGLGYWECPWSSVLKADGSQLLVQGPFADSVFAANFFAVLGGTGQYFGITGEMGDILTNPDNCWNYGFLETSPACACQYNKTVTTQVIKHN